jgi:hypothetical protein
MEKSLINVKRRGIRLLITARVPASLAKVARTSYVDIKDISKD